MEAYIPEYLKMLKVELSFIMTAREQKYTKSRRPVVLKYIELGFSHGNALKREIEIKRMSKLKKLKLINERRCLIKHDQYCDQI